ncbi:hypothetical protein KY284_004933 [Solanum tuberosum]|nr:hypothetical protein KY284_004933 [Solanum tuberosum]
MDSNHIVLESIEKPEIPISFQFSESYLSGGEVVSSLLSHVAAPKKDHPLCSPIAAASLLCFLPIEDVVMFNCGSSIEST